jgi:hypothetical protein
LAEWLNSSVLREAPLDKVEEFFPSQDLPMTVRHPTTEEVEQLLLNARLRDELEPYCDESVTLLSNRRLPTPEENEFLASLLAWERAPTLPISRWFEPELVLPHPDLLDDAQLHDLLWQTIQRLYDQRIVLELTDHLSDRQLYCLICRDILPSPEKKVDLPRNYLHWHCVDIDVDAETWLRYYANPHERREWAEETGFALPPCEPPPFLRQMPCRPRNPR